MFQFIIYQILFRKDFSDVPERIQDQVKEVLIDLDLAELAQ